MGHVIGHRAALAGLALALGGTAFGQAGPPAPSSLEDIRGCTLEGDSVFIVVGNEATPTRRYKYAWDASIDALCNAKGFAIATPPRPAAPPASAAAAVAAQPLPTAAAAAPRTAPVVNPGGAPREFPADAAALSAEALKRKITGKVFDVRLHDGTRWRLDYRGSGYLFVNVSGGGSISGPWRAEESRICAQMRGSPESCNEVREQGPRIYLKRDNGDVIALDPA
jgi:hypothetical protein